MVSFVSLSKLFRPDSFKSYVLCPFECRAGGLGYIPTKFSAGKTIAQVVLWEIVLDCPSGASAPLVQEGGNLLAEGAKESVKSKMER